VTVFIKLSGLLPYVSHHQSTTFSSYVTTSSSTNNNHNHNNNNNNETAISFCLQILHQLVETAHNDLQIPTIFASYQIDRKVVLESLPKLFPCLQREDTYEYEHIISDIMAMKPFLHTGKDHLWDYENFFPSTIATSNHDNNNNNNSGSMIHIYEILDLLLSKQELELQRRRNMESFA
jgi:hypothetical protein